MLSWVYNFYKVVDESVVDESVVDESVVNQSPEFIKKNSNRKKF